jgi:hypothetical protein
MVLLFMLYYKSNSYSFLWDNVALNYESWQGAGGSWQGSWQGAASSWQLTGKVGSGQKAVGT